MMRSQCLSGCLVVLLPVWSHSVWVLVLTLSMEEHNFVSRTQPADFLLKLHLTCVHLALPGHEPTIWMCCELYFHVTRAAHCSTQLG